jgi:tetratricopeptide (TPR) repeat protein
MDVSQATQLETDIDQALAHCDLDRAEELAARYRTVASAEASNGDPAHSLTLRSNYLAAQVALAGGRLRLASQRSAALMPLPEGVPEAWACRIWLLSAEALARSRRHAEARHHLDRARAIASSLSPDPLRQWRVLRIRLWLGEVADLADELAACARTLEERGDTANLSLLACEEGRAWDEQGDLNRAEQCWLRAERLSRSLGTDPIRADVLLQLGRLDHLRGFLQDALDHYDAALACSPARPQVLEVQLRRLLVLLDLNQWGHARSSFARLLGDGALDALPDELRGLAVMVRGLLDGEAPAADDAEPRAYHAAAQGDIVAAQALYRQALAEAPAPARRARLALALGMLGLAGADRVESEHWLRQAEELARTWDLPEVLWRTLQARGQRAAELEGDEERARRLFEEAVLIAETQARRLRHRADAAAYHLHRAGILRHLLRAACRRGDAAVVFRYQELDRGRLLLELWRAVPRSSGRDPVGQCPALAELDRRLEECERGLETSDADGSERVLRQREELLLQRDRLFDEYLRDRSRRGDAALPALPELAELERALPAGTVYVAPALFEDELYLLAARRGRPCQVLRAPGSAATLLGQLEQLRSTLAAQLERYRLGFSLGLRERAELDECLDELGQGALGSVLGQVLDAGPSSRERLLWVPDGALHGFPIHALRRNGRYLVEDHEVVFTFGGALFVYQAGRNYPPGRRGDRALVVTESAAVLPTAAREGEGVAASFRRSWTLHGLDATRANIRRHLPRVRLVHFACHAYFDARHPLAACIGLPSGETWRGLEWLEEAVSGLPLVTLSACRSAEVAPLVGHEVFGLVTGLLGSGVRAVLAGLWPVADRETSPLMWRFYRHRLTCDLAGALALAQREALADPDSSPLFWAAFALFGDAKALAAPGRWRRWWARWRQRRHARRFPVFEIPSAQRGQS